MTLSKSGRSLAYRGQNFHKANIGFKSNFYEAETSDAYWISGPRRDGQDRFYPQSTRPVDIDDDVREEYWTEIRAMPEAVERKRAN